MARRSETFEARFVAQDKLSPSIKSARAAIKGLRNELESLRGEGEGPVRTTDKLTRNLSKFSAETDRAAAAQRRLQRQISSGQRTGATNVITEVKARREMVKVLNQEAIARRKNELLRRRNLNSQGQAAEAVAADRVASALFRQRQAIAEVNQRRAQGLPVSTELARLARSELSITDARAVAEQNVAAVKQRQLIAQQEILARQAAGLRISRQLKSQAEGFEGAVKRTSRTSNSIFFTFRRLVGVLATFTLARNFFAGLRSGAVDAAKFGAELEIAELSIQTILTATGTLRDTLGQTVPLADQFSANLAGAQRQLANIRRDSLNTLATFSQLTDTFQVGLAPGRAAGLSIDEVQKFTVRISQAASAFGVAQNQLSEEIRSLLSGNISPRNTRIATALLIENEDIRNAREAGNLAEFLTDRFEAFEASADKARNTLAGVFLQLRGAAEVAVLDASAGFLEQLKESAKGLLENVVAVRDANGQLTPRPEFVAFLRAIFDEYERLTKALGDFALNIDLEDATISIGRFADTFRNVLQIFGEVASNIASITSGVIGGITALANALGGSSEATRSFVAAILTLRLVLGTQLVAALAKAVVGYSTYRAATTASAGATAGFGTALKVAIPRLLGAAAAFQSITTAVGGFAASSDDAGAILSTFRSIEKDADRVRKALANATSTDQVKALQDELAILNQRQKDNVKSYTQILDRIREIDNQSAGTQVTRSLAGAFGFDDDALRAATDRLTVDFDQLLKAQSDAADAIIRALGTTQSALATFNANTILPSSDIREFVAETSSQIRELELEARALTELTRVDPNELTGFSTQDVGQQLKIEDEINRIRQASALAKEREIELTKQLTDLESRRIEKLVATRQLLDNRDLSEGDRKALQDQARAQADGLADQVEEQQRLATVAGKILTERAQINSLLKDEELLQSKLASLTDLQLQGIISQASALARRNNELQDLPARVATAEANVEEASLDPTRRGLVDQASAEVALAKARLELRKQEGEQELRLLQTRISQAAQFTEERAQLQERFDLREQEIAQEERLLGLDVERAKLAQQRANQGPIQRGASDFLDRVGGSDSDGTKIEDRLGAGLERLTGTFLDTISTGLSGAIITALQGGDLDSFFNQLATTFGSAIIEELASQVVASAVSGLTSFAIGGAEGGAVPSAGSRGVAPPAGFDSRDRIPAYLRPGEHIMPPESVSKYSRRFMNMVQHGSLDPGLVKALMEGGGRTKGRMTRRVASFATGGGVSRNTVGAPVSRSKSSTGLTIMVADNQAMDRFMSGGGDRHLQRIGHRSSQYRRALGI